LLDDQSQQKFGMPLKRRSTAATWLRCNAASFFPALGQSTTTLGLGSEWSAASRRDAPASIASIIRARKSLEYCLGIDCRTQKNATETCPKFSSQLIERRKNDIFPHSPDDALNFGAACAIQI